MYQELRATGLTPVMLYYHPLLVVYTPGNCFPAGTRLKYGMGMINICI